MTIQENNFNLTGLPWLSENVGLPALTISIYSATNSMIPIKLVSPGLRRSLLFFVLFLCSTSLLTGCTAAIKSLPWAAKEELKVALADMELQEIKALETIFLLKVRIINPNDAPEELRSIKCDLKINGEPFASGISDEHKSLSPFGTVLMPVTVYTSKFGVVGSVIEMLQKDVQQYGGRPDEPLNYELNGRLHLGKNGKDVFPFHVSGKITLNR